MTVLSTRALRKLVAPADLVDVLEALKQQGLIEFYRISAATTCIEATKFAEIGLLIAEESKQKQNPRPYVANKQLTKQKK